jgi:hypothetical protein
MGRFPPNHLYVVHGGSGNGICGVEGLSLETHCSSTDQWNLAGMNSSTSRYSYRCRCGFVWVLSAPELEEFVQRGLHRSREERVWSQMPQRESTGPT